MDNQRIRLIVVIAAFLFTFGGVRAATHHRLDQQRSPDWRLLPYDIGEWRGVDGRFDPIYGNDPADTSLLRVYEKPGGAPVTVYVAFFGNLAAIMEVHTPELCYPAQGWEILSSRRLTAGTFRSMLIPASQILADKSGHRRLIVWWYHAGSRPIQTRLRYVYTMLVMSAFTGRTDGSMVRLEIPIDMQSEALARARMANFQERFLPELEKAFPQ